MNAQQIAALGEITRKAIADAVEPLAARIKELEGRPAYDPQPHAEASAAVLRSIGQINERIDTVAKSIPAPYDDEALAARLAKQIEAVRADIPAAYDDAAIKGALVDAEMRLGAKQSQEVEAILNRIKDARYDDTALRGEMDVLLKGVDVQLDCIRKSLPQDGKPGQDGADGRDALQLEVLPAIDEQKSYTRGTYAKNAGGLWRAFEQTSGMRGWECIVNGVKSVDAQWEGKTLIETTTLSDGTTHETRKSFAVQEYKGVFAHGEHEQGDTVTWAGSLWHCNKTGTEAKPGDGSADWTLAVKKGRDGREVVKTERVQQPVKINSRENNDSI